MTVEYMLEILPEVLKLIINPKNWSKNCTATKVGEMCPPWDLHADAWSLFGALEKVLIDKQQYSNLLSVHNELVIDAKDNLLQFNFINTHKDVIELLYQTMNRLADSIGWNMYRPLFSGEDPEDLVFFIPKEFDEELERESKKQQERMDAEMAEELAWLLNVADWYEGD